MPNYIVIKDNFGLSGASGHYSHYWKGDYNHTTWYAKPTVQSLVRDSAFADVSTKGISISRYLKAF